MTVDARLEYISIGGNRHPSAADWSFALGGLLAYGAGNSIALWNPLSSNHKGVVALLNGHNDTVNAIKFFQASQESAIIISGSVDKTLRAWKFDTDTLRSGKCTSIQIGQHDAAITSIDISPTADVVVTGSADCTVKLWHASALIDESASDQKLQETIKLKVMPLATAIHPLDKTHSILAVAGSHSNIFIYITQKDRPSRLVASLAGHAGWIRALSFTTETTESTSDLLLASASQDKFIRLWRIHLGDDNLTSKSKKAVDDPSLGAIGRAVSTKVHRFSLTEHNDSKSSLKTTPLSASITFEALLLGHEDWIYTAKWQRRRSSSSNDKNGDGKLQLLSASADSSLAVWQADPQSGIWVCITRLGELSAQKGSTTATGSAGGFWIGLWAPEGDAVVSLGRTGGWRVWVSPQQHNETEVEEEHEQEETWIPSVGCGGHVKSVSDVAWTRDGSYLLSTAADQTTRLHAEWKRDKQTTWHEFARPQIHGYDLNCIDTISLSKFVSGADEKPIRVFQEPASVASLLSDLCNIDEPKSALPPAANIPVLGLSNKEVDSVSADQRTDGDNISPPILSKTHPPLEDDLARHLLFPEVHKVYGHGLEISSVSVSIPFSTQGEERQVLASACRASSLDHAVIRLHDTTTWREYAPPLKAHTLTVTSLQWSPDARYLLSTSRDRMFSVFEHQPNEADPSKKLRMIAHIKGHSRMMLGCAWTHHESSPKFVTAGRDKTIKIWFLNEGVAEGCTLLSTIATTQPVTAVAVASDNRLAAGLEDGSILLMDLFADGNTMQPHVETVAAALCPTKPITKLSWRPSHTNGTGEKLALAVSSEDCSLRILSL